MNKYTLEPLPSINQRFEFIHYKRLLHEGAFRRQLEDKELKEFECGKFVWYGVQEGATVLVQRIILGIESWVPRAVALELGSNSKLTDDLLEDLRDPFRLKGRGTADCYYNKLPALVSAECKLETANVELWKLVRRFYRDIRNPISHGSYISDINEDKLKEIFIIFEELYKWCDSWCDFKRRINEIGGLGMKFQFDFS